MACYPGHVSRVLLLASWPAGFSGAGSVRLVTAVLPPSAADNKCAPLWSKGRRESSAVAEDDGLSPVRSQSGVRFLNHRMLTGCADFTPQKFPSSSRSKADIAYKDEFPIAGVLLKVIGRLQCGWHGRCKPHSGSRRECRFPMGWRHLGNRPGCHYSGCTAYVFHRPT